MTKLRGLRQERQVTIAATPGPMPKPKVALLDAVNDARRELYSLNRQIEGSPSIDTLRARIAVVEQFIAAAVEIGGSGGMRPFNGYAELYAFLAAHAVGECCAWVLWRKSSRLGPRGCKNRVECWPSDKPWAVHGWETSPLRGGVMSTRP